MAKTVEQISSELNLSITTVRMVLNGKAEQYRISKKTQSRIVEYVEQHGCSIHHTGGSARQLNRTGTLGLMLPRLSHLLFATLAEKLEIRCRERGYQLLINCTYGDVDYENRLIEMLLQRSVDGLFLLPSSLSALRQPFRYPHKPLVVLERDCGIPDASMVINDPLQGSAVLTRTLLSACQLPLFFVAGDGQDPVTKARLLGYQRALEERGLRLDGRWILTAPDNRHEDGVQLMRRFLQHNPQVVPQAFVVSSLPMLAGILQAVREHCGQLSPQMHIGLFDEPLEPGLLPGTLWFVQQTEDAWAEHACQAMLEVLEGGAATPCLVIPMTQIRHRSARQSSKVDDAVAVAEGAGRL